MSARGAVAGCGPSVAELRFGAAARLAAMALGAYLGAMCPRAVLRLSLLSLVLGLLACDAQPPPEPPSPATSPELSEPSAAPTAAAEPAPTPSPAEPAAADTPEARAFARAGEAAQKLGGALKQRLQAAMQEGGPEAAINVCADHAQQITAEAQAQGVRVGRASLRLRNPKNKGPAWVEAWLAAQGERPVAGLEPVRVVEGGTARLLKPIGVEPLCVTCHGPAESLPPGVKALLEQRYPDDRAVGYAAGELRGALWAEADL